MGLETARLVCRPLTLDDVDLLVALDRDPEVMRWGRGLATECGRAFVDAAFAELGASRVWAQTMAVNERSRRVLERCGLTYVRTFHLEWEEPIDGAELGEVEYEVRRADWLRHHGGQSP